MGDSLIGVSGNRGKLNGWNLLILRAGDGDRTHDVQAWEIDVRLNIKRITSHGVYTESQKPNKVANAV
jgi:hypothetical protein